MTDLTPQDHGKYTRDAELLTVGPHFPGVVQIVPKYDIQGIHQAVNVLYWEGSSTGYTIPMLLAAQTAFDTAWSTGWKILGAQGDRYMGSVITDMGSVTGLQLTNAGYIPVATTSAASSVPDNASYLLSLKGSVHYKGGHGRVYVPSVNTSVLQSNSNLLTTSGMTLLNNLWSNTVTAMAGVTTLNGGPYNPVIWHKKLHSAPNTVDIVVAGIAQQTLASQRRRLRRVAHH